MEIPKWFPFRKRTYGEKLSALRFKQAVEFQRALNEAQRAWSTFRGRSEDEIYDLFLKETLAEIARPAEDDQVFNWNNRTYMYMNGLDSFDLPYGRRIISRWLQLAKGNFVQEGTRAHQRMAEACTQALDLLQPPTILVKTINFQENIRSIEKIIPFKKNKELINIS